MDQNKTPAQINRELSEREYHGRLAITILISGEYQWLAPIFAFNVNREYPNYDVVIYSIGDLDPDMEKLLTLASCTLLRIATDVPPENIAAYRYLMESSWLHQYDYVLLTDVDMLIMREEPSLFTQHRRSMDKDDNQVYDNYLVGGDRVSAVHFVHRDWWEATREPRRLWARYLEKNLREWDFDEKMLLDIILNSKLKPPTKDAKLWNFHGIHMGARNRQKGFKLSALQQNYLRGFMADQERMDILNECIGHSALVGTTFNGLLEMAIDHNEGI